MVKEEYTSSSESSTIDISLMDNLNDQIFYKLKNEEENEDRFLKEDIHEASNSPVYAPDNEELYIAASPAFDSIKDDKRISLYDSELSIEQDSNGKVCSSQCDNQPFPLRSDLPVFSSELQSSSEYISIKIPDTLSTAHSIENQSFFISSDFSHFNIQNNSKNYYYVVSPVSNDQLTQESPDNNAECSTSLCNESDKDELNTDSNDTSLLAENKEKTCETSPVIKFTVSKDNMIGLDEDECGLNDFNRDNDNMTLVRTKYDQISTDFNEFIDSVAASKSQNKLSTSQLVWQHIELTEVEVVEKGKDEESSALLKLSADSEMEIPILQGQPYLQVALVNDLDQTSASDIVSTEQILGTTIPEVFTCKWEGCSIHKLTIEDLVTHVNSTHLQPDEDSNYICYWKKCGREMKPFDARYKILIHMRVHTGEKPHICNVQGCKAAFSRIENLKIHSRSHTGEKPYVCTYDGCAKSFANSSDRFKHKRTHAEKKPYHCNIPGCNKAYTDPSALRRHKKRPHKLINIVPIDGVT